MVPIGHSAMASYPYHFAAWRPGRTLAAVSVKGTWPDFRDVNSPPWRDEDLAGVPLLFMNGEYEDAQGRAGRAADFRARHPQSPLTMFVDAGGGHFDFHDRLADYLGRYLRTVAAQRLGLSVPGQVAIAGFNDLAGSDQMLPPLTTVRTPRAAVGEASARMLLALMRGEVPEHNSVNLGFELTVREST